MTPFIDFLADKMLPGFAMLKNAKISLVPGEGHRISEFEEAFWNHDISALRGQIPVPQLQTDKEAVEMASYKFSEEELKNKNFEFDDQPNALMDEVNDKLLYGESWSIFWCVRPDKDEVISLLITELEKDAGEKISGDQIKNIYHDKVNRLFFRPDSETSLPELSMLYEELMEELMDKVNESQKAPEEEAWEVLNEDHFWGDED